MDGEAQQIERVVAAALPGERLADCQQHGGGRLALRLVGGERLLFHTYPTAEAATRAKLALRLLRNEADLPVPALRAADTAGELVGVPYLLTGALAGEPLAQVAGRLREQQQYDLGRALGGAVARIHRVCAPAYGPLNAPDADDETGWVRQQAERATMAGEQAGLLNRASAAAVRQWAERHPPISTLPALLHGGIGLETVLVRATETGWRLGGLVGWGAALGGPPTWEHALTLDALAGTNLFSLRVGYGNGYDAATSRVAEQVRERALLPYRALLALRRMQMALETHEHDEAARLRTAALTLLAIQG